MGTKLVDTGQFGYEAGGQQPVWVRNWWTTAGLGTKLVDNKKSNLDAAQSLLTITVTNSAEEPVCPICVENMLDEECIYLPCGHFFHSGCIQRWLDVSNSCPICRYQLPSVGPKAPDRDLSIGASEERSESLGWYL